VKAPHQFLKGFLPRSESRSVYIFTMTCYSVAIDLVAVRLAAALGLWRVRSAPAAVESARHMLAQPWWRRGVVDLLVSPVVESLVIIAIIEVARRLKLGVLTGIVAATLLFSALHSFTIPIWGLICIPGFFIQAVSYNHWRCISFWAGLQAIVLVHAFSNLPSFLYAFGRTH
jgi:hypothetical protein